MPSSPSPQILERVQTILRRDLKLGPDIAIPPDMPLFGGDFDLDSLDVLLLVTSIEKELGVKVPSEKVGKEVFENVTTLARFIEQNAVTGEPAGGASSADSDRLEDLLDQLPHGPEFRFITRIESLKHGEEASATWQVKGDEDFLKGHFPGRPIVPGVLIAEALAQLCGLAGAPAGKSGALAQIELRFHRPVPPPATITLRSKLARTVGELQQFEVSAFVGAEVSASGTIALHRPE